tara:strand:- start:470 stop:715 length:246 start_codon:yes stop_codon:yes gene_type:complete
MEQRFTFIKTNEKTSDDDFVQEERVELEAVIEENDFGELSEKLTNFLSGCGHNVVVEIHDRDDEDFDDDDDEYDGGIEQTD